MFKAFSLVVLGLILISSSLSLKRNWRSFANCLQMGVSKQANVSSYDVLRFIHRHEYMVVPQSNPPTPFQLLTALNASKKRKTRSIGVTDTMKTHCPFDYEVIDFMKRGLDTVPRYLGKAVCSKDCDRRCKPVMYTHKLLFRKCKNYWMWTQRTLAVAFVRVLDD